MAKKGILTENQHRLLKFLIKNFGDDDGRVFCFDVQSDGITKLPPKKATSRLNFNELIFQNALISFEEKFERIETHAEPNSRN